MTHSLISAGGGVLSSERDGDRIVDGELDRVGLKATPIGLRMGLPFDRLEWGAFVEGAASAFGVPFWPRLLYDTTPEIMGS